MKNKCVGTIFVNNGIIELLREAVDSIGENEDMSSGITKKDKYSHKKSSRSMYSIYILNLQFTFSLKNGYC